MNRDFGKALCDIVGERWVAHGDGIAERYRVDIMGRYSARPAWLARPETTAQLSAIMHLANQKGVPVTVIGGQTGTSGGAVPMDGGLALSLERMNRILEIDTLSMSMTVEAGCILQTAQEAAEAHDAFLPIDLGARGSAMIGGVVGTNAG
ncbi:MAG: FAD-binding oxidoreductase, partial [Novosphingobium sp.]|nr:FAD-binding oxidoreductase [Novosphingobium sp.]